MKKLIIGLVMLLTVVTLACLPAGQAGAAVPEIISFQGRLTNASGLPLTGSQSVGFAIYDVASGGAALKTIPVAEVAADSNGLFSTTIDVSTLDFSAPYWLEISVGLPPTLLSPRQQLTTAAYAMRAKSVEGITMADYVRRSGDTMTGTLTMSSETAGAGVILKNAAGSKATIEAMTGNITTLGRITASATLEGTQLRSSAALGAAPLLVTSSTEVANLNVGYLQGKRAADFLTAATDNWVNYTGDTMIGTLEIGTATTKNITLEAGGNVKIAGNVGIGTTAPGGKLDIGGKTTFEAGGGMRTVKPVTAEAFFDGDGRVTGSQWNNVSGGISYTGKVKVIGRLEVGNSATTASGTDAIALGYNASAEGNYSTAMGIRTFAGGYVSTARGFETSASGDYSTALGANTIAGGSNSTALGNKINVAGNYSFGIGLDNAARTISQPNTMAILGGNVGIGTATPEAKLHVAGNVKVTGYQVSTIEGTLKVTTLEVTGTSPYVRTGGDTMTGTLEIGTSETAKNVTIESTTGNIKTKGVLTVSGTGISSFAGNVGIGTTGPGYRAEIGVLSGTVEPTSLKLDGAATGGVQIRIGDTYSGTVGTRYSGGDTYLASNSYQSALNSDSWSKGTSTYGSTVAILGLSVNASNPAFQLKYSPANTATGGLSSFFTNNLFTVLGDGRVGIGTTAPGYKLTVADPNAVAITAYRNDGVDNFRLIMGVNSTEAYIQDTYTTGPGLLNFKMGNSTVMTLAGSNVGIGTATPEAKLHVAGTASIEGALNMSNQKIINLGTPTASSDAATMGYVDITVGEAGTITGVTAGTGLTGGGTVGNVTLNVSYGATAGTAAQGNDSRLSDARTPTAHGLTDSAIHTVSGLTTGHFLKATDATSFGFAPHGLTAADVGAEPAFTALGVSKGGTGANSFTANQLVRANAAGTSLESSGIILPAGAIVGTSDAQILTSKTISLANNTILGLGSLATSNEVNSGTIADGTITNADIAGAAAIADSKLAAITTAGKVSGSAITSGTIGGDTIISTTGPITSDASVTADKFYGDGTNLTGVVTTAALSNYVRRSGDTMWGTLTLEGRVVYTPSLEAITAVAGVTAGMLDNKVIRIASTAGEVTAGIEAGTNGQIIILQGTNDTNTVKFNSSGNLKLAGGASFTLGLGDTLQLIYDSGTAAWYEISRSDN
ncbi:hypothetical protein A2625_00985 [candidate division WOR-1 bacterium RIFCSPHIGHO2_01_FULL_53_15]|uniref:Trimeric autotransporter adhesin YadA-like head domain-containing protein n=1 Tax=candidate division WOR-1 bacterium RIFCSPHIGHO2_01_FULL_53_15 TaxID=1802564 RepID=A0A1F4Q3E8_UNCSA|nr:MAG: hypothetical protein A2625_00985 [candidate division WOR-1 bacterium RIFCSPHIGHO2_01_FULL_53_15]